MADFNLFIPLSKVERQSDGSCLISGYASTPALDLDGEIITQDAVRKALPGYWQWRNIREMHTNSAVGVAKEANMDDKGLFLTSRIVDKAAVEKCLSGVYKGYSVGGKKLAKSGNTITEIELVEISVVDRPANPECSFTVSKSASKEAAAFLTKLPKVKQNPNTKTIRSLAKAALLLAKSDPSLDDPGNTEVSKPPMKCAAHGLESCDQGCCKAHGAADCNLCNNLDTAKRDFTESQRQASADRGHALPDGSFPIENKEDLRNARRLAGHSKTPGAARALIRQRARALGVKLPKDASKKMAKRLIAAAEDKLFSLEKTPTVVKSESAVPSFLTLSAGSEIPRLAGSIGRGHANDLGKGGLNSDLPFLTLTRKGTAMDNIKINDEDLAKAVLAALTKSGAKVTKASRMQMARDDIKKARQAVDDIKACMKSLHAMHKAGYLAKMEKAAKKPPKGGDNDADDNPFDHQGAMEKLQKGYGAVQMVKTLIKSAGVQLKKAASSGQQVTDGNEHYEVPAGVKSKTESDMDTAGGGSAPFVQGMIEPFPGKSGKNKGLGKGLITVEHAEALTRAAVAESKVEVLESLPVGPVNGRRPVAFDMTKVLGGDKDAATDIMKGVDLGRLHTEDGNRAEVGKMIGNMILGGHGKSVFDSDFRGSAGVKS